MYKFDKDLLARARSIFPTVYVDVDAGAEYIGHTEPDFCEGSRVRIYTSYWDYETPETFRTNEELRSFVNNWVAEFE